MYLNQIVEKILEEVSDISIIELRNLILRNYKCDKKGRGYSFSEDQAARIIRSMVRHFKEPKIYNLNMIIEEAREQHPISRAHAINFLREHAERHKIGINVYEVPERAAKKLIEKLVEYNKKQAEMYDLKSIVEEASKKRSVNKAKAMEFLRPRAESYRTGINVFKIPKADGKRLVRELVAYCKKLAKLTTPHAWISENYNGPSTNISNLYMRAKKVFGKLPREFPKDGPFAKQFRKWIKKQKNNQNKKYSIQEGAVTPKEAVKYLHEKDKGLFYIDNPEHLREYIQSKDEGKSEYVLIKKLEAAHTNGDLRFVPSGLVSRMIGGNWKINELQQNGQQLGIMATLNNPKYAGDSETTDGFLLVYVRKVFEKEGKQEELKELEKIVDKHEKQRRANMPGN